MDAIAVNNVAASLRSPVAKTASALGESLAELAGGPIDGRRPAADLHDGQLAWSAGKAEPSKRSQIQAFLSLDDGIRCQEDRRTQLLVEPLDA